MFSVYANDDDILYGIQKFVLDTEADIPYLPAAQLKAGSTALVIETSDTYMLNHSKIWKKLDSAKGVSWEEVIGKE